MCKYAHAFDTRVITNKICIVYVVVVGVFCGVGGGGGFCMFWFVCFCC